MGAALHYHGGGTHWRVRRNDRPRRSPTPATSAATVWWSTSATTGLVGRAQAMFPGSNKQSLH